MKFGIMAPYMQGPLEEGAYAGAFAQLAERRGFESVWAVDHVVMCPDYTSKYPYDPSGRSPFHENVSQPDPLQWLGHVGAVTSEIKLGTGILILPLRNPVVLAKTLASLDRLTGGRLLLGVGVGWVEEEASAVGVSFADRGRRTDEAIEAMRALWGNDPSSYAGQSVSFENVVSRPKPAQPAGIPIHIGGHSKAAARRAGRLGDGFYPLGVVGDELAALRSVMENAAVEARRDPATIEVTCVGDTQRETAEAYANLGVTRMLISPRTGDLAKLDLELSEFQRNVIDPLS